MAQRTAETGWQWDQNSQWKTLSRIFCERYVAIQAFEEGSFVAGKEIKRTPCMWTWRRADKVQKSKGRKTSKMILAKQHMRLKSLTAAAKAASLLLKILPWPLWVGTFWALGTRTFPRTAVALRAPVLILRHQFSLETAIEGGSESRPDSKFCANSFCMNPWQEPFSSYLPLSPGIKLQKQTGWRRLCQKGSFCFSSLPQTTRLTGVRGNENADKQFLVFILMV